MSRLFHIRWPKHCSFSFSISPSSEYSGLISFRIDWFDTLAVQGTLKSLLQHYASKASILLCSASYMVQISHSYMTTWKTIALTRWTFVAKESSNSFHWKAYSTFKVRPVLPKSVSEIYAPTRQHWLPTEPLCKWAPTQCASMMRIFNYGAVVLKLALAHLASC